MFDILSILALQLPSVCDRCNLVNSSARVPQNVYLSFARARTTVGLAVVLLISIAHKKMPTHGRCCPTTVVMPCRLHCCKKNLHGTSPDARLSLLTTSSTSSTKALRLTRCTRSLFNRLSRPYSRVVTVQSLPTVPPDLVRRTQCRVE